MAPPPQPDDGTGLNLPGAGADLNKGGAAGSLSASSDAMIKILAAPSSGQATLPGILPDGMANETPRPEHVHGEG